MKVVILCGGLGTRLGEETTLRPKPMVEIGGKPILWHIMNIYSSYGFNEFIIALGYKGEVIKNYFLNYFYNDSNLKIDLFDGSISAENMERSNWKIELIDTGESTLTGGRLKRLESYLKDERFMLTYGDGVANVNIKNLLQHHEKEGKLATVTAVRPVGRFGVMQFNGDDVTHFSEKPQTGEGWINGGFFVFEPNIFKYFINGDQEVLEGHPMEALVKDKQLTAYKHRGFWQCMDTLREKNLLDELWQSNKAPWKSW